MSMKSRKTRESAPSDNQLEPTRLIPWAEWTDAELNAEKWDIPKNGTDGHFLDPETRIMPPSIEPYDWKRGSMLGNLSSNPVVFTPSNDYPDFIKNNKHILHSEFVRWFISTMINLQYAGRGGLQVGGESTNFVWLGEALPWQGWMYVYSMNKAGNSAPQHGPVINPNGKYVVRLFFMGFWRRFIVDDMIPVDKDGTPLLPRTEKEFELWPMLLAKAMMKIAALSWTNQRDINDFYPVSCLTGWICLPLVTRPLSQTEKWDLLIRYVDREGEEVSMDRKIASTPEGMESTDSKKVKKRDPPLFRQNPHPSVEIFARLGNAVELAEDAIPDVTPCWSHSIFVDKFKDITADAKQERWKRYRYFDWVSKHAEAGSGDGSGPAARSLKFISPLRRCSQEGCDEYVRETEPALPKNEISKVSGRIAKGAAQLPDTQILLPDIVVWTDFSKLAPFLEEIFIFYKPSDFEYNARVSDVLGIKTADSQLHVSAAGSRVKSQATVGKDGRKAQAASASSVAAAPSFQSSLKWQPRTSGDKNDFLYMLIDSIDSKFVLIDFCSMPQSNPAPGTSYLIVERQNFFKRWSDDDPIALIKTYSSGATIFEPEPGRHLYRILFRSGYSYFIRILSDTIFYVGGRFRMYELMSLESDRIDAIAKNISNRLSMAFQEFGRPGYAGELQTFYDSYMPRDVDTLQFNVQKGFIQSIHQIFIDQLAKLIKETFTDIETTTICRSLRVFFLNPSIGVGSRNSRSDYQIEEDECREPSVYEIAANRIQSFFRMIQIKVYKRMHEPSHARHSEIVRDLRKVVEMFDYSKHESVANFLIRKIIGITRDEQPTLLYPCHSDLSQVLNVEEWRGVVRNVQPGQWVPVLRVIVNAPTSKDTVHAGIDFATSLPRYIIRVVSNETYREVMRFVNKVATVHYPYAKHGYTLIGYGWSEGYKFKELDWCVRVTTIKGQPTFRQMVGSKPVSLGTKAPSLAVQELSDNYIPNARNIIGKWLVTAFVDCLLSLRLSTSYSMVETVIKITDADGNVLCEASGGSVLILPVVHLSVVAEPMNEEGPGDIVEARSRSKSLIPDPVKDEGAAGTEYYVRAYVDNDSWPLTATEWTVAYDAKSRGTVYDPSYGRNSVSSVSKRTMRIRVRPHGDGDATSDGTSQTIFQDPLCRLQVLTDVGTKVQVEQDRRREKEIGELKRIWEDAEPGRLLRGRELREEFIKSNSTVSRTSSNSAESVGELFERETLSGEDPETREIRTLKAPSNLPGVLPPWNITACISKDDDDDEEERWVKTEGDEEMLRNQRAINALDFDQAQAAHMDEEIVLLQEQRQRYANLFSSYIKKVNDWQSLADAACEKREIYLTQVKETLSAGAGKNVKDKMKKNKKK